MTYHQLEALKGEKVEYALEHEDDVYLVMIDGRIARLRPEGDCCASAYIASVYNPEALTVAEIISVEDLENGSYHDAGYTFTDVWGHRINTSQGACVLDCRTEHNGYYSGWLNLDYVDSVPEGSIPLRER